MVSCALFPSPEFDYGGGQPERVDLLEKINPVRYSKKLKDKKATLEPRIQWSTDKTNETWGTFPNLRRVKSYG